MPREVFDKAFKIAAVKLILEEGQFNFRVHPKIVYIAGFKKTKNMEKERSQDRGALFVMPKA